MMPTSITELEARALQTGPEDRAHLADRLLASLSSDADWDGARFYATSELVGGGGAPRLHCDRLILYNITYMYKGSS